MRASRRLLRPASVAVVGATDRPGSYAAQALLNLGKIGFAGAGVGRQPPPAARSWATPACPPWPTCRSPSTPSSWRSRRPGVAEVIEQAGARGCGGAVVFSAGFGEVAERRRPSRASSSRPPAATGCRCAGPTATGSSRRGRASRCGATPCRAPEPGAVALVSQSGNVAVNALATRRGLRFHTVIASGNQAVLSAADYLEFLAGEDGVGAVALYLEDDGGPRLCDGLAACAEAGVPRGGAQGGALAGGARAAAAHSGALAGDQRVFRSLIREAGAVWAEDVHDLLELAKTLAVRPARGGARPGRRPRGERAGDHDLLGRGLRPGRRRGAADRPGAAGAGARHRRAPARAAPERRHGGQPARLHGDDLGRPRRRWPSSSRRWARTRRSGRCSCSTTSPTG